MTALGFSSLVDILRGLADMQAGRLVFIALSFLSFTCAISVHIHMRRPKQKKDIQSIPRIERELRLYNGCIEYTPEMEPYGICSQRWLRPKPLKGWKQDQLDQSHKTEEGNLNIEKLSTLISYNAHSLFTDMERRDVKQINLRCTHGVPTLKKL